MFSFDVIMINNQKQLEDIFHVKLMICWKEEMFRKLKSPFFPLCVKPAPANDHVLMCEGWWLLNEVTCDLHHAGLNFRVLLHK